MATSEDLDVATRGDFFMATDTHPLTTSFLIGGVFPDLAERLWCQVRRDLRVVDGTVQADFGALDRFDPGNYTSTNAFTLAWLAAAAREAGDDQVATAAISGIDLDRLPSRCCGGPRSGMSNLAAATLALATSGAPGPFARMVSEGLGGGSGPQLERTPYPQLLVAGATSKPGQLDLDLLADVPTVASLLVDRLVPGRLYRADPDAGAGVEADQTGIATFEVRIDGRQRIRIVESN